MPMGKGTYGSKKGRPPVKGKKMGVSNQPTKGKLGVSNQPTKGKLKKNGVSNLPTKGKKMNKGLSKLPVAVRRKILGNKKK